MTKEVTTQATSPLFFRDILGQERVLGYLKAAFNRGRLAHAYLFLGPEGVGKESVARALAAALNCADLREDGDACGVCPSCKRLAAGTHPDFLVIRPTSKERPPKIVIDQIRELRRVTAYPPVAGGWRVTLIKPGEDMRDDTANALLKTLEEPPPQHLLILTAGVEADIFPTVVSRCQKLAFTPLPYPLITAELQRRGLSPSQAALLAALSGGSLGRALALEPEDLLRQRKKRNRSGGEKREEGWEEERGDRQLYPVIPTLVPGSFAVILRGAGAAFGPPGPGSGTPGRGGLESPGRLAGQTSRPE
ncbi:MAG: DNA polymerase III subunit delta' [Syntrophobacterales bacterium]